MPSPCQCPPPPTPSCTVTAPWRLLTCSSKISESQRHYLLPQNIISHLKGGDCDEPDLLPGIGPGHQHLRRTHVRAGHLPWLGRPGLRHQGTVCCQLYTLNLHRLSFYFIVLVINSEKYLNIDVKMEIKFMFCYVRFFGLVDWLDLNVLPLF